MPECQGWFKGGLIDIIAVNAGGVIKGARLQGRSGGSILISDTGQAYTHRIHP